MYDIKRPMLYFQEESHASPLSFAGVSWPTAEGHAVTGQRAGAAKDSAPHSQHAAGQPRRQGAAGFQDQAGGGRSADGGSAR